MPFATTLTTPEERRLESRSDALLRPYFRQEDGIAKHGIYRELDLERRLHRDLSIDTLPVDFPDDSALIDDCRTVSDTEPTLAELIAVAHLTTQQRRAVRSLQRRKRQRLVAAELGIKQPQVSKLLAEARRKITAAAKELRDSAPEEWALKLWREETTYKRRLCYKKHVTHHRTRQPKVLSLDVRDSEE